MLHRWHACLVRRASKREWDGAMHTGVQSQRTPCFTSSSATVAVADAAATPCIAACAARHTAEPSIGWCYLKHAISQLLATGCRGLRQNDAKWQIAGFETEKLEWIKTSADLDELLNHGLRDPPQEPKESYHLQVGNGTYPYHSVASHLFNWPLPPPLPPHLHRISILATSSAN